MEKRHLERSMVEKGLKKKELKRTYSNPIITGYIFKGRSGYAYKTYDKYKHCKKSIEHRERDVKRKRRPRNSWMNAVRKNHEEKNKAMFLYELCLNLKLRCN